MSKSANKEVITGGDFRRMLAGAYSEFLLEYDEIDRVDMSIGNNHRPGTNVLRTMGAVLEPLNDSSDESIGGLAHCVASAAIFGARGTAGVVLAQMLYGIAKGLSGKVEATSSEFGKAFQYGIALAQRVISGNAEPQIITVAKAVAKSAHHAVRASLPITEILSVAVDAGDKALSRMDKEPSGTMIVAFLRGCMKGLDGNFVSPVMNLSLGLSRSREDTIDPRLDVVCPYCLTFRIVQTRADASQAEKILKEQCGTVMVQRRNNVLYVHLHTAHPGRIIESVLGWGILKKLEIRDMSEPHALAHVRTSLMSVAVLAIAEDDTAAKKLEDQGATVILRGNASIPPSVGEIVNAAHSDIATDYIMVANSTAERSVLEQAKYVLGDRLEMVIAEGTAAQLKALGSFDASKTIKENAARMQQAADI